MKKRSKQRVVSAFKSHQSATVSIESILRDARTFPILECWIAAGWQKYSGLVQIIVARQQPNKKICCGVYLVDMHCLGLKNTFARTNLSRERYQEVYDAVDESQTLEECSIELAHQMIYEAIDYAAQFGFKPQSDWAQTQYMLEPRGQLEEPYKLTFGQDGKPFYVSGPYDNVEQIIKQLEETAGHGNYDVVINLR
jgi:hypothetical protein